MSNRRISSNYNLKPIQAITVDAFSNFNSNNINRLTRIVSKSSKNDVIVNGLDVYGVDDPFSIKSSNLLDGCAWQSDGCTVTTNQFEFQKRDDSKYYVWCDTFIDPNSIPHDASYSGYFELQFQLFNGTPSYLVFNLNKHVLDLKHIDMFKDPKTGLCKLFFKYDFNFDTKFYFRIGVYIDSKDPKTFTTDSNIILKNVALHQIFDNSKLDYYLCNESSIDLECFGNSQVHPIHELAVSPGVAIKDDVTIDILKSNFIDNKVVKLPVNDPNSWILRNPYTVNDFTTKYFDPHKVVVGNKTDNLDNVYLDYKTQQLTWQFNPNNEAVMTDDFKRTSNEYNISFSAQTQNNRVRLTYNKSRIHQNSKWLVVVNNNNIVYSVLNPYYLNTNSIEFYNDGFADTQDIQLKELAGVVKVAGTRYSKKLTMWAYVVVYSAYFKDPVVNKNYIGLIRQEDLDKPEYRDDYLVLAKVRFIDPYTVDIITYSNSRQDLGVIDAEDVNYFVTCKNGEIWNDDVPNTVTDALDILRLKQIDLFVKQKYKHDYDAEISDAFNLVKPNNATSNVKTKYVIDDTNHLLKQTTNVKNKIKVTKIENDKNNPPSPYFNTISVDDEFVLNSDGTHFIFTDSNNTKWAVKSDFTAFGMYDESLHGDKIYRKYLSFNTVGPVKFIDKDTSLPVIEFDWVYDDNEELRIPSSVNTTVGSDEKLHVDTTTENADVKDDYFLTYTPSVSNSESSNNNKKNHTQFLMFRNNLLNTERISKYLDYLPKNPSSLLNRRVIYGVKDSDGRVRIYSSRHQLSNDMIDYHIMTAVNNDSGLVVNPNNDGIHDKSTQFIFKGDIDNSFRTNTFLTSETIGQTKKIVDIDYYYKNLIDNRIVISTDRDDDQVYHIESSSYDLNDLRYQYWYKPSAMVINNVLHLRIDTEKNFVVRASDLVNFLYNYCTEHDILLSTFINKDVNLFGRKMFDIVVDIDCSVSRARDLDRIRDGEYEVLDKYFKSKLLLINDLDENIYVGEDSQSYFNSYINADFTLFYYPRFIQRCVPFRLAYDKSGNYIRQLSIDESDISQRQLISNNQFIWKDDRRGWNNREVQLDTNKVTSKLELYPATSKTRVTQTVADEIDDNNAFNKARGVISHTYAGCRTEFNFEYIKRVEPQELPENATEYGIENSIDQDEDDYIDAETQDEKFIHIVDKLYATSDYYTIPNAKGSVPIHIDLDYMNWIFTTDDGVISVLNTAEIVGEALDELDLYDIDDFIDESKNDNAYIEFLNSETDKIAHIRYHHLQNTNNKNNGCLSLTPDAKEDSSKEYFRWLISWQGTTGIWRSTDTRCQNPLSLISTSNKSNSTTFDVKQMVSWRNGISEEQCLVVLSSQNKNNMSTVEVIPYETIFTLNPDGTHMYKYVSYDPDPTKGEGKIWTSFIDNSGRTKDKDKDPVEFLDHMLVNNICIANDKDGNDLLMYLGKQRKDQFRFPPEDRNGKCSDTPHHAPLIHNGTNANGKLIKNSGFAINRNIKKLSAQVIPDGTVPKLIFDKQEPALCTIDTIYTKHLDNSGGNRFLSVGCLNNFNTGIDWELTSYYSWGGKSPELQPNQSLVNYCDSAIKKLSVSYGIPKKVFEYDTKVYIATTNGILRLNVFNNTDDVKWFDFKPQLKHTKWDDLPYNYRYSIAQKPVAWMTHGMANSYGDSSLAATDNLNVTDMCKIKNGVFGVCGLFHVSIYDRDRFKKLTGENDFNSSHLENLLGVKDVDLSNENATIEYDSFNNKLLVYGLCRISVNNNNISITHKRYIYDFNTGNGYVANSNDIKQVIAISATTYAGIDEDGITCLWNVSYDSTGKATFSNKQISTVTNTYRLAYFNKKLYCFTLNGIKVINSFDPISVSSISNSHTYNYCSRAIYDFDSIFVFRRTNVSQTSTKTIHKFRLTKITADSVKNVSDEISLNDDDVKRFNILKANIVNNCTKQYANTVYRMWYSPQSKMLASKFKNNGIVFGINASISPQYYNQFTEVVDNNVAIAANGINYPDGKPMTNICMGCTWIGNAYYLDQYPALTDYNKFSYYNLIYDRNIDLLLSSVNANVTVFYDSICCA